MEENDFVSPYPLDEYGLPIFKPLPEASVIEFKELLEQEYGLTLTMDEATDVTNRLVQARYLLDIHPIVRQLLREQEEQKLKGLPFNPMPKRAPRRKSQTKRRRKHKPARLGPLPRGTDLSPEAAMRRRARRITKSRRSRLAD